MRLQGVFLASVVTTAVVFGYAVLPGRAQEAGGVSSTTSVVDVAMPPTEWGRAEVMVRDSHRKLMAVWPSADHKPLSCRVQSIDDRGVTCRGRKHRRVAREEVGELILPGSHTGVVIWLTSFLSLGAGAMTAACMFGVATLGASIPLWILGVLLVYMGLFGAAFSDDGGSVVVYRGGSGASAVPSR